MRSRRNALLANWTIPIHLDERGKKTMRAVLFLFSLVMEMYDMCESGYLP